MSVPDGYAALKSLVNFARSGAYSTLIRTLIRDSGSETYASGFCNKALEKGARAFVWEGRCF